MMGTEVRISIFLNNEIHCAAGLLDDLLVDFYEKLRQEAAAPRYTECKFYQLRNPVLVRRGQLDEAKKECLKARNREELTDPTTRKVRDLAEVLKADYIYLAIDFPDTSTESDIAIRKLGEKHGALFECLQLTIETVGRWGPGDVVRNLRGGVLVENDDGLPLQLKRIRDALEKPRLYEGTHEKTRDFGNAQSYDARFDCVFASSGTRSRTVTKVREFAAFYNVLRCFHKDTASIHDETSSPLKARNFTVYFIQPPFFSENQSHHFVYHQEESWRFPVFLNTKSSPDTWWKFTPKSDFMVASPLFNIPFIISEMISENEENDRSRMLVEAIALARTGQFLLKSTSKKRFFVVAIYLDATLVASRYIVMQTGRGNGVDTKAIYKHKAVCIHRKDFDLRQEEKSVDFLREMDNLETQINELAEDLDKNKRQNLAGIKVGADKVLTLSSVHHQRKSLGAARQDTISEGHEEPDEPRNEGDIDRFQAKDIQNVLREMNYRIEFTPSRWHSRLAHIVNKTGDKHGYLKFVETVSEVRILRYLTNIQSISNHTVSGVQFWPVQGGTVISMPIAGALQLIEAVAFMHEHNIAHMSLSPQHVIIPLKGGRLSIIDFGAAIHLNKPDAKHVGVIGTEGYIAPEVYNGEYKPMLADLWSCGKILEELCAQCLFPSADRQKILYISKQLMNRDPEARPKMTTVVQPG